MSTVLPAKYAALVANLDTDSLDIYLPSDVPDDAPIPDLFLLLCACAAKANADPQWVKDTLDWFVQFCDEKEEEGNT